MADARGERQEWINHLALEKGCWKELNPDTGIAKVIDGWLDLRRRLVEVKGLKLITLLDKGADELSGFVGELMSLDERRLEKCSMFVIGEEYHGVIARIKEEFPEWVAPEVKAGEIVSGGC